MHIYIYMYCLYIYILLEHSSLSMCALLSNGRTYEHKDLRSIRHDDIHLHVPIDVSIYIFLYIDMRHPRVPLKCA